MACRHFLKDALEVLSGCVIPWGLTKGTLERPEHRQRCIHIL
jgi:hypothetical protein